MVIRVVVRSNGRVPDHRGQAVLAGAESLGMPGLRSAAVADLYFLRGDLDAAVIGRICVELLCDPVTEQYTWAEVAAGVKQDEPGLVEVAFLPGVTDPVAEQ